MDDKLHIVTYKVVLLHQWISLRAHLQEPPQKNHGTSMVSAVRFSQQNQSVAASAVNHVASCNINIGCPPTSTAHFCFICCPNCLKQQHVI